MKTLRRLLLGLFLSATIPSLTLASQCDTGNTSQYQEPGPYEVVRAENLGQYRIYVPEDLGSCRHPIVVFAPGIGMVPSLYSNIYRHLASYGFMVVVDRNFLINSPGYGLTRGIDLIRESEEYGDLVAPKAGVMGHSMGGGAALNAEKRKNVAAVVAWMPGISWNRTEKPTLYLGGTDDFFGSWTDPKNRFKRSKGPRFLVEVEGGRHVTDSTVIGGALKRQATKTYLGATTAWFKCFLADDRAACRLFEDSSKGSCQIKGDLTHCEGRDL